MMRRHDSDMRSRLDDMKQTIQDINFEIMSRMEADIGRPESYRFSARESRHSSYNGSDEGEVLSPINELQPKFSLTSPTPARDRRYGMYDSGEILQLSFLDSPSESGGEDTPEIERASGISPLIFDASSLGSSISEGRFRRSVIIAPTSSPVTGLATHGRSISNEFLASSHPEMRNRSYTADSRLSRSSFEIRESASTPQKKKSKVVSWLKRITSMDSRKTRHSFDGKVSH